jgi:hypothetical protein
VGRHVWRRHPHTAMCRIRRRGLIYMAALPTRVGGATATDYCIVHASR